MTLFCPWADNEATMTWQKRKTAHTVDLDLCGIAVRFSDMKLENEIKYQLYLKVRNLFFVLREHEMYLLIITNGHKPAS